MLQETDAIVNAANTSLMGGGGVDGAIHRAAGPVLKKLCSQFPSDERGRRCQTGDVKTTPAGNLPAKRIIHAVGPVYRQEQASKASQQLRRVHQRALEAAIEHDCRSIAFPAISTGAYRFPIDQASAIAIDTACSFLDQKPGIELVRFVLYSPDQRRVFEESLIRWPPSRG